MAILIDPPLWPAHGRRWSHLVSDTSVRELHAFAARLGLPERGFEGDHYDVPEERYAQAVRAGAIPVSTRELLRRLQLSGLRRPKRRGERVVTSHLDEDAGHRIDSVLSAMPPLGPVVRVHVVLVHAGHVLVVDDGEGYRLPSADLGPMPGPTPGPKLGPASGPTPGRALGPTPGPTRGQPPGPTRGQPPGQPPGRPERAGWEVARQRAWTLGRELVTGLVGAGHADGPARQVGYLRRVREGRSVPVDVELVLRWPDPGLTGDPGALPASPGGTADPGMLRWVPARRAVVLLPVDLAPIALDEHHRVRPPGAEDPGPLNPEGR